MCRLIVNYFVLLYQVLLMRKVKKILSLVLLVLYTSYYTSTTCFVHTHQTPWGPVTHSHPYTSGTHTHSTNALQLIASLTTLLFIGGGALFFPALLSVAKALVSRFHNEKTIKSLIGCIQLRAPPLFELS